MEHLPSIVKHDAAQLNKAIELTDWINSCPSWITSHVPVGDFIESLSEQRDKLLPQIDRYFSSIVGAYGTRMYVVCGVLVMEIIAHQHHRVIKFVPDEE